MSRDKYSGKIRLLYKATSVWVLVSLMALPVLAQNIQKAEANREVIASISDLHGNVKVHRGGAHAAVLNKVISLSLQEATLKQALQEIATQAGLKLSYSTQFVPLSEKLTVDLDHVTVGDALWKVLEGTALRFAISPNKHLVLMKKDEIRSKAVLEVISGTVTDAASGETLPGVNIAVKGTTTGTSTDAQGTYELNVASLGDTLLFSFIGYQTQEVPINGRTVIDVALQPQAIAGEELVVTGYMVQKKADLTGSVSVVSSDEVEKNQHSNVIKSLQGKVPGMHITTDGNPVGNVNIQIRGMTSVRSAPPLIVIDGMPTQANLRDINPGDIASIQVLKDAASASIYGSRAASGVILIETKKGREGDLQISYDGTFGVSSFLNRFDMMNTQQYGQALWRAAINDGMDPGTATDIYTYEWHEDDNGVPVLDKVTPREWLNTDQTMRSADTDWFEEGTQLGLQNDHQITVSSGTDKSSTLLSLNYYENRGTQLHTGFRRLAFRLNSEYQLINDKLTIGENLSVSNMKLNNQNVMHSLLTMPPIIPVYTTDGGWGGTAYEFGMDDYNNPVRQLTLNKDNSNYSNKVLGSVFANMNILRNLHFRTQFGVDYTSGFYRHIDFTWREGGGKQDVENGVRANQSHSLNMTWSNTLNYMLDVGNHELDLLAGMETVRHTFEDLHGFRRDIELENYDYAYISSATGNQEVYGNGNEYAMLSYFSKFNYVYNNKYLLSGTVRYDGSSKFGENNQFGLFPAVSAGWRLSEESFLKDSKVISNLKLRASWGMNGNSNIPIDGLVNFYDANYNATAYALAGNETGTIYSGYRRRHIGNPNLQWEATKQTDVGIDFALFDEALTGSVSYYHKFTDGMLYEPPYIAAIGEGGHQWINAANMTNTGVELQLTYFNSVGKDLSYSISANASTNKNRIDDLPESVKYTYGGNGLDDDILGRSINSFYGFVSDGLFRSQEEVDNSPEQPGKGLGRIQYKDLNNDGRITWDHDRTWLGNRDPDLMYGVTFNASYKNFDFNMFWQGVAGNLVRNDWKTYSDFWNVWTQSGFNHSTRVLDAWSPSNPDSDIPALTNNDSNDERRLSTYFLESGSYLKLRHIEVGYNFPVDLTSDLGMREFRIYVLAENLINIIKWWGDDAYTGIDPETPSKSGEYSSPYIRPQLFKAGINLSF